MRTAIMQPYLFPYIGYWQLLNAVDTFVIYDNVQFIKGGWINRNKVLINEKPNLFTFSVKKGSTFENINEKYFSQNILKERRKLLKTIKENYKSAPYFDTVFELIEEATKFKLDDNIAYNITHSINILKKYMEIDTKLIFSSEKFDNFRDLSREQRVIEINKKLGTTMYINLIGGIDLYSRNSFMNEGIDLRFLHTKKSLEYQQNSTEFIPNLSIIDVLMFNSKEEVQQLLEKYQLESIY